MQGQCQLALRRGLPAAFARVANLENHARPTSAFPSDAIALPRAVPVRCRLDARVGSVQDRHLPSLRPEHLGQRRPFRQAAEAPPAHGRFLPRSTPGPPLPARRQASANVAGSANICRRRSVNWCFRTKRVATRNSGRSSPANARPRRHIRAAHLPHNETPSAPGKIFRPTLSGRPLPSGPRPPAVIAPMAQGADSARRLLCA
jgi:hypothetical protein